MRYVMHAMLIAALACAAATAWTGRSVAGEGVARHWTLALWAAVLVLMAHTLVLFYFLATGKQLRLLMQASGRPVNRDYLLRVAAMRASVLPWAMATLGLVIATFVLGGGVLWGAVPRWVHAASGYLAATVTAVATAVEMRHIERNAALIRAIESDYLDARPSTAAAEPRPDA